MRARLAAGWARVRRGWKAVWDDTHLVMGTRLRAHIEFTCWTPVLALLTPVLFVIGALGALPVRMALACPACGRQHVDLGEWATRPHRTHLCASCGAEWRPALHPTVGV